MATKTIADVNVAGKTVLMRVDFNVPLSAGKVNDDRRIRMAIPSIRKVIDDGGKLILVSHLGRPKGEGFEVEFSLRPVADRLSELLGKEVKLGPPAVVGPETKKMVAQMSAADVILLENVRFAKGETSKDQGELDAFSEQLGSLAEVYVNDAFGTCHRQHASMYGAAKVIRAAGGPAIAGFLVEKEIKYLHEAVDEPQRPFVAILGGAKVSDKIKLIDSLLGKVDRILIGGAMAYTLQKAQGAAVGKSLVEADQIEAMKELLGRARDKILLPVDHICTKDFDKGKPVAIPDVDIPDNLMGMDIGGETCEQFARVIADAKTIVWNGPMGVFEQEAYAAGTKAVAVAIARATESGAVSVIGGGDSGAAVAQMNLDDKMTHVSTGGGAALTYLEGKPMPAIEVLDDK